MDKVYLMQIKKAEVCGTGPFLLIVVTDLKSKI